jgi:hypothetical protein
MGKNENDSPNIVKFLKKSHIQKKFFKKVEALFVELKIEACSKEV